MRVLGVDPGFASFGYALLDVGPSEEIVLQMGVLRTEPSSKKLRVLATEDNLRRAKEVAHDLFFLVEENEVKIVCAESMSWPRNASAAAKVAMSWGCIASVIEKHGLSAAQASPQQVKKTLCGKKDASKEEVAQALRNRYRGCERFAEGVISSQQEHCYDALAAVVACLDSELIRVARTFAKHAQP